jgi:hypothetical protein
MSDVEIYNNDCRVTVQGGISLVGVNRGWIHDNTVQCTNDYAITLAGSVTNSTVERNKVMTVTSPNSCGQNPGGAYKSSSIGETNASNANNVFRDNIAAAVFVNGSGSQAVGGALADGSGQSFRVPVGLNGGLAGGLQLLPLAGPVLAQKAGNFGGGSCVLTGAAYFYKVRGVTAGGGMGVPSNEVTFNNGGGFGCGGIKWNKLAGAASYNIYRSTTTNSELLIDNVADGSTFYDDFGGQTPTTPVDLFDSSIVVKAVESDPPAGAGGIDFLWPDKSGHCWKLINNNGTPSCVAFTPTGTGYMHVTAGVLDAASSTGLVSSLIDQQGPAAAIVGTGADATLFTKTISANTIAAGKCFDVIVGWAHTTGAAAVTYKIKLGSTTLVTAGPTNDTNVGSDITAHICNAAGVQNSQYFHVLTITGSATDTVFLSNGTSAENTANPLALTATMSAPATDQVTPKFWKVSGDDSR